MDTLYIISKLYNMPEWFSYPEACISICYEVYNYICSATLKVPTLHMNNGIYIRVLYYNLAIALLYNIVLLYYISQ